MPEFSTLQWVCVLAFLCIGGILLEIRRQVSKFNLATLWILIMSLVTLLFISGCATPQSGGRKIKPVYDRPQAHWILTGIGRYKYRDRSGCYVCACAGGACTCQETYCND